MQGEAERALRCRPPSLPNRPHFDADSIDSAITRPLVQLAQRELTSALERRTQGLHLAGSGLVIKAITVALSALSLALATPSFASKRAASAARV